MPASILIVDDEAGIRESLGALLRDEGYDVAAVDSGEACLEILEERKFELVLLDVWLKSWTDWIRSNGCGRTTMPQW
jgi:DNA-binding NtrC family response regulator